MSHARPSGRERRSEPSEDRYADPDLTLDADEDDWAWRAKIKRNPTSRLVYRIAVAVVGVAIVVLGIVLLPAPGPGWLIIFAGLGVLASEFEWAQRVLQFAKRRVRQWTRWIGRQAWWVKILVGLATLLVVLLAFYLLFLVSGVPRWLPDFVENPIRSLPGLS